MRLPPCFPRPPGVELAARLLTRLSEAQRVGLLRAWRDFDAGRAGPQQLARDLAALGVAAPTARPRERFAVLRLVVGAKGAPLPCSYSNDGTPMTVRKRVVLQGVAGRTHREGGASCELLCQRAIFRSRDRTTGGVADCHFASRPGTPGAWQRGRPSF